MKIPYPLALIVAVLGVLVACTPVAPTATAEPPQANPTGVVPQLDLGSLPPGSVLLQRDYEPGFTRPELHYPYGRIAPFTLFADGTLVYLREGQVESDQRLLQVSLSPEAALELWQEVLEAGFERLESHTDFCKDLENGTQECVADAGTWILRARLADGELREIKIYSDFANDPAAFEQINRLLAGYEHPNAQPYELEGATLFLRPMSEPAGTAVQEWPLDKQWLSQLQAGIEETVAVPLKGESLAQYLAVVSGNIGDAFFEREGTVYAAYLVPWLPGADYTAEIQSEFPGIPEISAADQPAPAHGRFTGCPVIEPPVLGPLSLAWIEAGDLWVWDQSAGEPYGLPAAGEVTALRLLSADETVLFTQQAPQGPELWASSLDGRDMRLLAGGSALTGSLEIISPSPDGELVAFNHLLPDGSGELWVASLDGSGAQRLVSQEDLMAVVAEPLADFATPAGVTWIPGTRKLTYDASPGFENEGIYIFTQRQVLVVDGDSGAQEVLLPFGEGGQVAYSPDGVFMTIATPERLQIMALESGDRHEAEIGYAAIGMGEFYAHPPMAWTLDSQALLVAQPDPEAADREWPYLDSVPVTIWSLSADGTSATKVAELPGFFPSFDFSPDRTRVAFWRSVAPQSNTRQLHLAALDGSQQVTYDTGEVLEFLGWGPDSQAFVYVTQGAGAESWQAQVGGACVDPVPMGVEFYPGGLTWLNPIRFLFEHRQEGVFELYMGLAETPDMPQLLLNLEGVSGYSHAVLSAEE